jgi:hypothetical protein
MDCLPVIRYLEKNFGYKKPKIYTHQTHTYSGDMNNNKMEYMNEELGAEYLED